MLSAITRFFEECLNPIPADTASQQQTKLQLACAALLLELCAADQDESEQELALLRDILRTTFKLDEQALAQLWELARRENKAATSLFQFTNLINAGFSYEQKYTLLEQLWQVAYADGRLDRYEEYLIRKVADLLYLSHGDFIRAKLAVKAAT